MKVQLTQDQVKQMFDYHEDGFLIWKVANSRRIKTGDVAGSFCKSTGYFTVFINGVNYQLHRIIFLWHHGYLPENDTDHEDQNPINNKVENLREISRSCNSINSKLMSNNTSGVKGVSWVKSKSKWISRIHQNGKTELLGYFLEFTDAVKARYKKEVELNWNICLNLSSSCKYLQERGLL